MPRLTAVDVIKKVLAKFGIKDRNVHAVESALREETLHYSRSGAETMTRRLADAIRASGGSILLNQDVAAVAISNGRATAVTTRDATTGLESHIACDYLINTIPLPHLVQRTTGDTVPEAVRASCSHLRYKPITIHGLLVRKAKCIDGLYIYYRDRIFHRVGEPKNAGLTVNPPDHSVLIVETTCEEGDDKWNATQEVRERIMTDLEAENIVSRDRIAEWHVLHAQQGYPVFRLGFEPHFQNVMNWIGSIANLRTAGRQGAFCYPNMHSAMRQGAKAADAIENQISADKATTTASQS
jgi:protoporphyrinogen oxidase